MSSGHYPTLKRPWEVESSSSSRSQLHRDSQSSRSSEPSPYGQDISGWHYTSYERPPPPWDCGDAGDSAPRESHAKRTRLGPELGDMLDQARPDHAKPLSPDHFPPREFRGPQMAASALGPVMSLGYQPKMPPSPRAGSPPDFGRGARQPGPSGPVLPSPSSLPGSAIPGQAPGQSLPPLAVPESATPANSSPGQFQELQHQLAATDVQLKRLQMAHEDLRKDHDRAKARLATYDRKSKTADQELEMLHEEKFSLLDRVTSLEKELDETRRQKNEVHELHVREGAQWRRIISLSNTLQKQHSDAAEKWNKERGEMTSRIGTLEDQVRRMKIASAAGSVDSGSQEGGEDDSSISRGEGNPSAFLSREIQRVRMQEEHAKQRLREYQEGSHELRDLLARVKNVMERMEGAQQPSLDPGRTDDSQFL